MLAIFLSLLISFEKILSGQTKSHFLLLVSPYLKPAKLNPTPLKKNLAKPNLFVIIAQTIIELSKSSLKLIFENLFIKISNSRNS
jgi:hypothetical protein